VLTSVSGTEFHRSSLKLFIW